MEFSRWALRILIVSQSTLRMCKLWGNGWAGFKVEWNVSVWPLVYGSESIVCWNCCSTVYSKSPRPFLRWRKGSTESRAKLGFFCSGFAATFPFFHWSCFVFCGFFYCSILVVLLDILSNINLVNIERPLLSLLEVTCAEFSLYCTVQSNVHVSQCEWYECVRYGCATCFIHELIIHVYEK